MFFYTAIEKKISLVLQERRVSTETPS